MAGPQLWDANPRSITPPDLPGDELYLVWIDGQPRLRMRRGRDVKLEPNMRVSELNLAIPIIPLDQIGPWLQVVQDCCGGRTQWRALYCLRVPAASVECTGRPRVWPGSFPEGERAYGIYRPGEAYYDPVTNELLGYQARTSAMPGC